MKKNNYGEHYSDMQERLVKWGKGSSFNISEQIGGSIFAAERFKSPEGKRWGFMIKQHSGHGEWYCHYHGMYYDTVEELNNAILWEVARLEDSRSL